MNWLIEKFTVVTGCCVIVTHSLICLKRLCDVSHIMIQGFNSLKLKKCIYRCTVIHGSIHPKPEEISIGVLWYRDQSTHNWRHIYRYTIIQGLINLNKNGISGHRSIIIDSKGIYTFFQRYFWFELGTLCSSGTHQINQNILDKLHLRYREIHLSAKIHIGQSTWDIGGEVQFIFLLEYTKHSPPEI